ncbi:hypothetical protein SAMN04490357_2115 [Streptomyces misionensis]|uniref:C2H2-type domain-containing protein n=1 Tax=Streptomyces misionensis TaxID=67331 RepID=A0A1H4SWB8_9ACTN|nr:hypothetical protein [Streptomyces misionensis]SEC48436.1 hypothetical protein SAMN04490357_2115 [Streptomyces misionensis]
MTRYQCGSCSYRSDHLGDAQQHSQQTGHVCIGKDDAGPTGGRFGKARVVVKAGAGVLAATAIGAVGALAWKCKGLQEERDGLLSMASGLVAQLAEATAENESLRSENDYLKSATGAAKTLKSYDDRVG